MDVKEHAKYTVSLSSAFRPGAPINKLALFAGRSEQVQDILSTVVQPGRHVILYGERGVGKTSLASVLSDILAGNKVQLVQAAKLTCDGTSTFSSIWRELFRELSIVLPAKALGFLKNERQTTLRLDELLPENVTPNDIRYVLQRINVRLLLIIDEVDRIRDREVTALLADTIKILSDHAVNTTIILVGVADSVDQLIAEHHSIERALQQVPVPRMSMDELLEILDKGYKQAGMKITHEAMHYIAWLSQGLPHYTHLLGLHSGQRALSDDRLEVNWDDVKAAIRGTVAKAGSVLSDYYRAVNSPQKNLYEQVLLACSLAPKDQLGFFTASDVREPMSAIMRKRYDIPAFSRHLYDFCEDDRGPILQKTGDKWRYRFRFLNPLMQPFVVIHGLSAGLVPDEYIRMADPDLLKPRDD
ncbi:MAG: ATP-binding protein [Chloroflexota bacterium]|nr:ATP-binding protein [Chloroflexota bacterium]MDQ5865832.1 ATP-binding protein [Chloroflexota bacterium]